MNALGALGSQANVQVLGWTLVHFLWQGILVAALLACADVLLRRSAATLRYAAACAALALMAGLPVATFIGLRAAAPRMPAAVFVIPADSPVLAVKAGDPDPATPPDLRAAAVPA